MAAKARRAEKIAVHSPTACKMKGNKSLRKKQLPQGKHAAAALDAGKGHGPWCHSDSGSTGSEPGRRGHGQGQRQGQGQHHMASRLQGRASGSF